MQDEDFDILLQKADPDRRLAALFATPEVRDRLFALYAFNHELGKIAEATSESMIGEMKLTWWRDAVSDLYADSPKVRRHAVTEGLAPLTDIIPEAEFQGLIEARFDDISARPFATLDDVIDYVDATASRLARLAVRIAGADMSADHLNAAGRAWGLTGLLRAFPHRARIGRAPVGGDALGAVGATPAMLAQGLGEAKVRDALEPVRDAARSAIAGLRAGGALPAEAVPALGYAVLAPAYFKHLPESPYAIAPDRPLLARQMRLTWLSLTGR
ncbi:squalene/phytoene synthase family protein [Maricaulis parjimensis]|uniref:squalene/phytoene synthase family protein n=1 Tax=Maricaulis parjimensis TaxID=144023 RepID=UPI0019392BDE|nr:squalene/phytoene synthase family protein [Maricaulis parjimensis]